MSETRNSTDLRVIKTKKAIRNAFAELLVEKDINDITVKDVADRAIINRKTFYNYYKGIHQIVDEIENEVIEAFDLAVKEFNFENPLLIFSKLTAIINSDFDFYGALLKMDGNVSLVSKLKAALKRKAQDAFAGQIELDADTLSTVLEYAISGMISVYQNWFNSDRRKSLEELGDIVSQMSFWGITGVVNKCSEDRDHEAT